MKIGFLPWLLSCLSVDAFNIDYTPLISYLDALNWEDWQDSSKLGAFWRVMSLFVVGVNHEVAEVALVLVDLASSLSNTRNISWTTSSSSGVTDMFSPVSSLQPRRLSRRIPPGRASILVQRIHWTAFLSRYSVALSRIWVSDN